MLLLFSGLFIAALAGPTAVRREDERPAPSPVLCSPMRNVETTPNRYVWDITIADGLFEQGEYRSAARAYYQVFRCGKWAPLHPYVMEANLLGAFDAALRTAAAGEFADAALKLNETLKVLPQFGEARFLQGVFEWSAGMHTKARTTWRSTVSAPYFAEPEVETPFPALEARKLLRWSELQK